MSDEVTLDVDDQVATLTLNRPAKLNAVTAEMSAAIVRAVEWCDGTDEVRAIVVTGAGRAFSAGSDIRELDRYATPWDFRNRTDYCDAIRAARTPTIAAVNGYALGGGLETALSCDIRIASTAATFAAPEIKLGWIGGGGMTSLLSRAIGPGNTALMIMTGEPIDAEQALRWHLISEVVSPDGLTARATAIAATIASRAPIAAETAKINLRAAYSLPEDKALEYERDLQTICFATEDAAEGRLAFTEKRAPVFRRR
ncbi:enoyl-CoA hydratase/isomerase family protein [Pseudonocardia sp. DSM 110487]|uniref:enoyl-CoA hydratase/isomerase family protein n=1 Tax=Pseudonocardia sp. DSM 110487 TaxID=2865833 RepID=UPI001C6A8122|nr:enoyl-CoA hydratase/isomerase family protein [Pseudonocardia sp. DSM 110487]QYN39527.1 enoyl-CoA hydratase/isomerase family protein [Pseudonocardia sp. DSM 110487]